MTNYESWGRYPKVNHKQILKSYWNNDINDLKNIEGNILPFGLGKSYGDSCLNPDNTLIDMSGTNKFISFDREKSTITANAGVTLAETLDLITPERYFLAVTPGTKFITVGGAIANDVHGKNHHKAGTFGSQVLWFELLKSDGTKTICSPTENKELFSATIGGLGLTGIITKAEFKIRKVSSPFIRMESIKFSSLADFFEINNESDEKYDYTVSWLDLSAKGKKLGRGLYSRGNHLDINKFPEPKLNNKKGIPTFPLDYPFINPLTVKMFNLLYYNKQIAKVKEATVDYNPFFYPLDAVNNWNKAYGKKGFLQYQFVIPFDNVESNLHNIIKFISETGLCSFLTVLKTFGDAKSPGMLSFPRPGVTMAVDFSYNGQNILDKLKILNKMVRDLGGVLYPAKDAQMSSDDFHTFYPQFEEFKKYIDPKFSSGFLRRVQ